MSAVDREYAAALSEKLELEAFDFIHEEPYPAMCSAFRCGHEKRRHVERVEWIPELSQYVTLSGYCVLCRITASDEPGHLFEEEPELDDNRP